jgi:D-glycero-D-manno-heptose 1,7-bisphosphate phosphatase
LEVDVFPGLVARGLLAGFAYDGPFIDIGVPDDLDYARTKWDEFVRKPATFYDRDGVLNHDDGYTHKIEGFRWIDGAMAGVKACNDAGRYVFVVSNQAGVARGFYGEEDVRRLHDWMNDELRKIGAHVDEFRYCPHHPDGVVAEYARRCDCRKPEPGMIMVLLEKWPVDLNHSCLYGDKETDMDAAKRVDLDGIMVVS